MLIYLGHHKRWLKNIKSLVSNIVYTIFTSKTFRHDAVVWYTWHCYSSADEFYFFICRRMTNKRAVHLMVSDNRRLCKFAKLEFISLTFQTRCQPLQNWVSKRDGLKRIIRKRMGIWLFGTRISHRTKANIFTIIWEGVTIPSWLCPSVEGSHILIPTWFTNRYPFRRNVDALWDS